MFLWFIVVAYMILKRDIWTPLAWHVAGLYKVNNDCVLLAIIALLLLLIFQQLIYALR